MTDLEDFMDNRERRIAEAFLAIEDDIEKKPPRLRKGLAFLILAVIIFSFLLSLICFW